LAVPTPLDQLHNPDTSYIQRACEQIKPHLKLGTLIVNESTSYPGTLRNLIRPALGEENLYAVAPERVDPGNLSWNIQNTPRIVGALDTESLRSCISFYSTFTDTVIPTSSPEVAEAAKLFENTFRQVNIALVNEFSMIAQSLDISSIETINAAASKPFGFMKFLPSVGVGGHCIPVDPTYLSFAANKVGEQAQFIELANRINREMPIRIAQKLNRKYNLRDAQVQIAGLSYKANTSDMRESPSLQLMTELRKFGAKVFWHDNLVKTYQNEQTTPIKAADFGIICVSHDLVDYRPWVDSKTRIIDLSTASNLPFKKFL
jgi:UDP-N-acetyl-D-glucosamine dehydrogenase